MMAFHALTASLDTTFPPLTVSSILQVQRVTERWDMGK